MTNKISEAANRISPTFETMAIVPITDSSTNGNNARAMDELIRSNLQINKLISDVIIPKLDAVQNAATTTNNTNNTNNGTINNNTTINNKVSISVFLTENCGNALNLTDFINGIQVNLNDLDYMRSNQIESSVKNALIRALTEVGINQRPIHCTDEKRNTLYVRENGEWGKDTPDHRLLKSGIGVIRDGHFQQLKEWQKLNDRHLVNGPQKDAYLDILHKCTAEIDDGAEGRIISSIAKTTSYGGYPPQPPIAGK
jgi:hypothetical protein